MHVKDALRSALEMNHNIVKSTLADLADADLLVRPVPGANHIAWQLGHLIGAEARFLGMIPGAAPAELPAGFAEQHTKEKAGSDTGFRTKKEYLDLFDRVRGQTVAALQRVADADLDRPVEGPIARLAPTVGALFMLTANHELMHSGQFSVVRRKLGKPVLF